MHFEREDYNKLVKGLGLVLHPADDLGEARQDAEPMDWVSTARRMDEDHPPFPCAAIFHGRPCRGTVVWWPGDGYRCRECDTPHDEDQTIHKFTEEVR